MAAEMFSKHALWCSNMRTDEKQEEYGSAPALVLGHAETLCHLKRHYSISKQLKNFD